MSFQKWDEGKEAARTNHLLLPSGRQIQSGLLQECKLDGCLENEAFQQNIENPEMDQIC